MRELVSTLWANHDNLELYLGILDSLDSLKKELSKERWQTYMSENQEVADRLEKIFTDSGFLALGVPEEFGGMGGGFMGPILFSEVTGSCGIWSISMLTHFARYPVIKYGTSEQIQEWVVPTITGEKKFCIIVTEPNAGTNTFNITTRAKKSGNKWILNGQKTFITNAHSADYGLLIAKTDIDRPTALSVFIIDLKSLGISMQPQDISVLPNEKQWTVFFDDVEMPETALIGEEGKGAHYMFDGLNPERFFVAAACLGISELALKVASEHVKQRSPFGKPIGAYQSIQHPLAKAKAETDAARLMLYHGMKKYDDGGDAGREANMAKYLASMACYSMCDAALQFHGGSGFDKNVGLIGLFNMARLMRIAPVNNEMVLNYIAEYTIGLPKSY